MHVLKSLFLSVTNSPNADERAHIEHLREKIRSLPALPIPTEQMSAGEKIWIEFRRKLRDAILTQDPRYFLQWDFIISGMFCGGFEVELDTLKDSREWNTWRRGIREQKLGYPTRFKSYPESSGNLIHHAYSLLRFMETFEVKFSDISSIFEFGGGYGSAAFLYHQLGFRGDHVIFDLPEFSLLQGYYLSSIENDSSITLLSDLDSLKEKMTSSPDLFVGTWSLSESPIELREAIFSRVPNPQYFLIAYQNTLGTINNVAYFKAFAEERPQYEWKTLPIPHLPGNEYLFGKRKI